ncbi:MAG: electron transfer flavoprotein subunit beta/FixA family protein [Burkholderiales bacterium]|jgi:electron transfer flavoprotein beta subunit|nr:electron transfer flavoprotein subunit beta/FixA family protein [Burkholderiales bacterium]
MKILVPVKQVIDPSFPVRLKDDCSGLDFDMVRLVMNPYDEVALEEALQWRENGRAESIVAVSCGSESSLDVLRNALAMGADRALLIETRYAISPLVLARLLKAVALIERCDVIFIGRQGMGNDGNQVAPMLAALLDWSSISFAEAMTLSEDGQNIIAQVRNDGDGDMLTAPLPAVVSIELGMKVPRYATMQNLIKAKKAVIPKKQADALGVDLEMKVAVVQFRRPPERSGGEIVADVSALLEKLRHNVLE